MAMEKEKKTKNIPKLKIILLGDSGVGKTALINQYVNKKFQSKPTGDFENAISKTLEVDGKHVTLEIQDTRGQERYGGLDAAFFSNAKACMLVYDVNDPKSLDNLENWHNEFSTRVIPNSTRLKISPFIVLGNKADIDGGKTKEVYNERARKWCGSKGIHNMLTSAKDNKYVDDAFQYIAQLALEQEIENFHTNGNVIPQKPPRKDPPILPLNKPSTRSSLSTGPQKLEGDASKPVNNLETKKPSNNTIPNNYQSISTNKPSHSSQNTFTNNPPHKPPTDYKPTHRPQENPSNKQSCCTIL